MFNIAIDTAAFKRLNDKLKKYPQAAINAGMSAVTEFLEGEKPKLYPPSQVGKPFEWTSDKQRRYVMMVLREQGGPPYQRTGALADSVKFVYGKSGGMSYIGAESTSPYARFVIGSQDQIIGHRKRGWKPINQFITDRRARVVSIFSKAAKNAWDKIEAFMYGGASGL